MNNNISSLQNLLKDHQTLSLKELEKVKLLDRQDTKFVFNQVQLPLILDKIKPFYRILEINNDLLFTYENTYFDTDDFLFYNQHHNEKRERYKVRFRKYSSNSNTFFEIKIKNNKNRTVKKRLMVDEMNGCLGEREIELVSNVIVSDVGNPRVMSVSEPVSKVLPVSVILTSVFEPTCVEKTAALVPLSVSNSPATNVPTVSNVSNNTVDVFAADLIIDVLFAKSVRVSVAENEPETFEISIQT